jgi:hypothetical protein
MPIGIPLNTAVVSLTGLHTVCYIRVHSFYVRATSLELFNDEYSAGGDVMTC